MGQRQHGPHPEKNDSLTGLGCFQAWFEVRGLTVFLRCDIRLRGNLTACAWLHPPGFYERPPLRRSPLEPRQYGHPRGGLGHTGWGTLPQGCFNTGAGVSQRTLPPMHRHLWEFFDAACAVLVAVAVEGRCGYGAQATACCRRQTLTLQGERCHFALPPRVGMMKSPILQRFPLGCGQLDLVPWRASW